MGPVIPKGSAWMIFMVFVLPLPVTEGIRMLAQIPPDCRMILEVMGKMRMIPHVSRIVNQTRVPVQLARYLRMFIQILVVKPGKLAPVDALPIRRGWSHRPRCCGRGLCMQGGQRRQHQSKQDSNQQ